MEAFDIIKNYFNDITFQEKGHKYFVGKRKLEKSVSNLIEDFYDPFPVLEASIRTAKKENKTHEQVQKEWKKKSDIACKEGSETHLFGENYVFDRGLKPISKKEEAIVKFFNDLPDFIIPVMPEIVMYHKHLFFAGTADLLLYNTKTNTYIIADYKTNEDLFKNYNGKRMIKMFSHLYDNPFNHYQIQLSLYQILFEQISPSYEVGMRTIIWLLPDGNYQLYNTDDYTKALKEFYKC